MPSGSGRYGQDQVRRTLDPPPAGEPAPFPRPRRPDTGLMTAAPPQHHPGRLPDHQGLPAGALTHRPGPQLPGITHIRAESPLRQPHDRTPQQDREERMCPPRGRRLRLEQCPRSHQARGHRDRDRQPDEDPERTTAPRLTPQPSPGRLRGTQRPRDIRYPRHPRPHRRHRQPRATRRRRTVRCRRRVRSRRRVRCRRVPTHRRRITHRSTTLTRMTRQRGSVMGHMNSCWHRNSHPETRCGDMSTAGTGR